MGETDAEAQDAGYVSNEARRTFTLMAGVLGGAFLLLHLVVIVFATVIATPLGMAQVEVGEIHASRAARFQGDLCAVRSSITPTLSEPTQSTALVRLADDKVITLEPLGREEPYLLVASGRLLLISASRVTSFDGRELHDLGASALEGEIGRPFLHEGRPAMLEWRDESLALRVWDGARWEEPVDIAGSLGPCGWCVRQAASTPQGLWLFKAQEGAITARLAHQTDAPWELVARDPGEWHAYTDSVGPHVLTVRHGEARVLSRRGGHWRADRLDFAAPEAVFEVAALPGPTPGALTVLLQGMPGSLRVIELQGTQVTSNRRLGEGWFFPRQMFIWMVVPQAIAGGLTLLLAIVLAGLMRQYRTVTRRGAASEARYATLTRRAIAQIVDATIVGLPGLALFWWGYGRVVDVFEEGPFLVARLLTMLVVTFAWTVAALLAISATEGLWGGSPGKWLLGIRVVGTDLRPCGMLRAVIRNVLELVDGLFGFLVGTLLVAFTPEWQRLGDLAARTIVVRCPVPGCRREDISRTGH